MKLKNIAITVAIVALLSLVYWPILRWLVQSWLSNDYYSHGFLVPIVSGFFIWIKRRELKTREPSIIGAFIIALGGLIYILGLIWDLRFLSAFSLLIILVGLSMLFYGIKATRLMLFPLCFLIFMIPLPFMQEVGFSLQSISVRSSAWLLSAMGLPITTIGPEIHLENNVFTIGLACSGINTLIALLALAAVYVFILRGVLYRRTILFIIALPIAIMANILRITAIILVANSFGVAIATGLFHDLSSFIFFVIAFLILVLLGKLLKCRIGIPVT